MDLVLRAENHQQLIDVAQAKMPFGKYQGRHLIDLPESYLVWYRNKGFPKGKLGQQMQIIFEIKLNGFEDLIRNIQKKFPK